MAVSEIMFFRADERAQDIMGTVSISYYISNPNQSQKMVIDLNSWKIIKDEKIKSKETALDVPIHQIEFLVISGIIEKATKELESNNMKYAGIKQFYILPENGKPTYKFTLDGQPNNTSITTKGKYMAIHYQEVHFNVDSTGNQEIQIDKKLRKKRSGLK